MTDEKRKIVRRIQGAANTLERIADDVSALQQTEQPKATEPIVIRRIADDNSNCNMQSYIDRGYEPLVGDAGKSGSEFFTVLVRKSTREVVIFCPTFLRGDLFLHFMDGGFSAGY